MSTQSSSVGERYNEYLQNNDSPYTETPKEFAKREEAEKVQGFFSRNYDAFFNAFRNRLPEKNKLAIPMIKAELIKARVFIEGQKREIGCVFTIFALAVCIFFSPNSLHKLALQVDLLCL
jgi:hypothetical protein